MIDSVEVAMFTTGTVQIRPEHVGPTRFPTFLWLLTSKVWARPRPINVYVVKHPSGTVVFDTGQDIASVKDPHYFPKGILKWLFARLAKFEIPENQTFENGLSALDVKLAEVDYVILSHMHQDHIGGLRSFIETNAKVIVDANEIKAASKPGAVLNGYMRKHIFGLGINFETPPFAELASGQVPGFTHGWDVFGDGLVFVLPMPGHTKGSLALLANYDRANPVLLVGDLTYDARLLKLREVPGVGNKTVMLKAVDKVLNLMTAAPHLTIAAAHDPNVSLEKHVEGIV